MKSLFYSLYICFAILLFCLSDIHAQSKTIQGKILDVKTKEPVPFCNIFYRKSKIVSNTDDDGNFKLGIPENEIGYLIFICIGYKTDSISIKSALINQIILLKPSSGTLNEVVITGVGRATLNRENPVAIMSINSKAIEQNLESNVMDVLAKIAPGMTMVKTGPNISKPFIRGLGYNRVLTLFDGIRQEGQQWGDEHSVEVDAYNLQKAEVIKGPSSLMYGSDAIAGVVSLFPYVPEEKDAKIHAKYVAEYQTNNGMIGNGFRISYSAKHFAAALRGSYRLATNYRNNIDNWVYNTGFEEKNMSLLLAYNNTKWSINLNFTLYDNLQGIPDGSRDSLSREFTKQIYEGAFDDVNARPIVGENELSSYRLSPLHQHIQHYRVYSNSKLKMAKGDLDLLLAFQQNVRREYNHPTQTEQAGLYLKLNTFNYGLKYNLPSLKRFETTIGLNGMAQNNRSVNATDFPIPDYDLFDIGGFIYSKWKYKRISISGGLRMDLRNLKWDDFYVRTNSSNGFDEHVKTPNIAGAQLQFTNFNRVFSGLSSSIGLTYFIRDHVNLKLNLARGYRAPSITELASNGLDPGAHIIYLGNRNFLPEFSIQEDVGITAEYSDFSASVSLFNNHIQNYIYLNLLVDEFNKPIVDDQLNKTYQYQQASAQLYGTECNLILHPKSWKGLIIENTLAIIYAYNRDSKYIDKQLQGEYLPLIPPIKFTSSISKKLNLKSKKLTGFTPKIELDFNASQNRYLALNGTETYTPSYSLIHLGISSDAIAIGKSSLQLNFQINNVLDENYQSNLNRLKYFEYYSYSTSGKRGIYNMGRNACLKIVWQF